MGIWSFERVIIWWMMLFMLIFSFLYSTILFWLETYSLLIFQIRRDYFFIHLSHVIVHLTVPAIFYWVSNQQLSLINQEEAYFIFGFFRLGIRLLSIVQWTSCVSDKMFKFSTNKLIQKCIGSSFSLWEKARMRDF